MKKIIITAMVLCSILLFSCASTGSQEEETYDYDDDYSTEVIQPQTEVSDSFIGDFDAFQIDKLMFLQRSNNTVKPKEINTVYLVPRTNTVEFHFRDNINTIVVILDKAERDKILETCEYFLKQYDEKTLPHQKINEKTAYFTSTCEMYFGVLSAATKCSKTAYYMNCEFIDKRPYLLLKFQPTRCDEADAYTPKISLYMSPSQIREFMNVMNQENLNNQVMSLNEKAYVY